MDSHGPPSSIVRRAGPAALIAALIVAAAIAPLSAPARADHQDDPRFEITVPEDTVTPGETLELVVLIVNDHADVDDTVETARNVKATMSSGDTPIEVLSGTKLLGNLRDGNVTRATFRIQVPRNIEDGTHRLPVRLEYEYERDERGSATVHAEVRVPDRARFAVVSTGTNLSVGETGPIDVTLENVGSETARDASVTLESRSGAVGFDGSSADTRYVGTWAPGERKTVSYEATLARSAGTTRYALAATVDYEDANGNTMSSGALSTGVTPLPEQRFAVTNVTSTLQVGGEGVFAGTIENRGPKTVRNAVVEFSPDNPTIEPRETEYAVGTLEPNESARFRFPAAMSDTAGAGPRQFSVSVRYGDRDGDRQRSASIDVSAPVAGEQTFVATDTTSTLRVGSEGTLSGTIENAGPMAVRNAVVVFETEGTTVNPVETEYAVGDLAPGERAPFSFDVEVSEAADAGPRLFTISVRYRDDRGDVRTSDSIDVRAGIGEKRDAFDVTPVEATLSPGSDGRLVLSVTNTGNETVTDVSAKLFANAPITASDDEAFVDRLEPGASAEIVFGIGVAGSALEKTYPVSIDFQYDDADGDTLLSDTYQIPVRVDGGSGNAGSPLAVLGGALLAVVAIVGGVFLYRRRGH